MKNVIYYNKPQKQRPRPRSVQQLQLSTEDLIEDPESVQLQKGRVNFLREQMKKCPQSRAAYTNLPFIEQQILDFQIDLQNEQISNKQLRKMVKVLQSQVVFLLAELQQQKRIGNERSEKIAYLTDNLDAYKKRNEALLVKLQKMVQYFEGGEANTQPATSQQLKELRQLRDENFQLAQKLKIERSKSQKRARSEKEPPKPTQKDINDIKRLIEENTAGTLKQVYKNQIQKIMFQNNKIEQQATIQRRLWKNGLFTEPVVTRCEVPGKGIQVLRQLAKRLNRDQQKLSAEAVQKDIAVLSDQLRLQMDNCASKIYLCLGQIVQLCQFVLYDGGSLLKLLGRFSEKKLFQQSQQSLLVNQQNEIVIQTLQALMNNYGANYANNYNQIDYFKQLDYYKKKDYVQLNEQQVQNFAYGAAMSIRNYILENHALSTVNYFSILREFFEDLLMNHRIHDTLPMIYQIVFQKDQFSEIEWSNVFTLYDNMQMLDYTLMFCCHCFTLLLGGFTCQLFEIYEGCKRLLMERYQQYIRIDDMNYLGDDQVCCVYFPCFVGEEISLKARVSGK